MHMQDLLPMVRHDADLVEGAMAALIILAFLGLALGAAAIDMARLIASVLGSAA
jgi:hypothetical protein